MNSKRLLTVATFAVAGSLGAFGASTLDHVDMLIGTEGTGSQYGGMMPYTCAPFGSFQLVPMTRLHRYPWKRRETGR